MTKYCLKIGEKLTLNGILSVNGVVTSNLDVTIAAQARTPNGNEAFDFVYTSLESDEDSVGAFKLELDTSAMSAGQYKADVKYVLSDGSIHYDETFEISLDYPETRT